MTYMWNIRITPFTLSNSARAQFVPRAAGSLSPLSHMEAHSRSPTHPLANTHTRKHTPIDIVDTAHRTCSHGASRYIKTNSTHPASRGDDQKPRLVGTYEPQETRTDGRRRGAGQATRVACASNALAPLGGVST